MFFRLKTFKGKILFKVFDITEHKISRCYLTNTVAVEVYNTK